MRDFNFKNILIFCLLFGVIYLVIRNNDDNIKQAIKNHPLIITSTITNTEKAGYRSGYLRLYVEFIWKDKIVKADFSSPKTECAVIGRELLLIVDSTNIENVKLLLKPEDFSEFNLTFPDSLSWTKECFKL